MTARKSRVKEYTLSYNWLNLHTYHGEESADGPDHDGHVDAAGGLEDPSGGDKDAAPDDTAHDNRAAVEKGHLGLQAHRLSRLLHGNLDVVTLWFRQRKKTVINLS